MGAPTGDGGRALACLFLFGRHLCRSILFSWGGAAALPLQLGPFRSETWRLAGSSRQGAAPGRLRQASPVCRFGTDLFFVVLARRFAHARINTYSLTGFTLVERRRWSCSASQGRYCGLPG